MKEILFITNRLKKDNKSGGYLGSKRNLENIVTIFGKEKVDVYDVISKNIFSRIVNITFFNRLESSSLIIENKIVKKIEIENYNIIFLDNSGFGYLAERIKKKFPKKKIIIFCHDINYCFFSSVLTEYKKDRFNLKSFFRILKAKKEIFNAKINEKKSFKNADKIITLNSRDTKLLEKEYGYKSDAEIEVTLPIPKIKVELKKIFNSLEFNLLFVGTASLKPNLNGVEFFIKNVLEGVEADLYIVGKGMEKYKEKFEKLNKKVKVIGTVENLDNYYLDADAVIAPIFAGGGMKVKTGEALSYGKTIFGTIESFQGYELDYDKVGGICNCSEEFIEKINNYIKYWKNNGMPKINKYTNKIFIEKYSYNSSIKKFKKLFKELKVKGNINDNTI